MSKSRPVSTIFQLHHASKTDHVTVSLRLLMGVKHRLSWGRSYERLLVNVWQPSPPNSRRQQQDSHESVIRGGARVSKGGSLQGIQSTSGVCSDIRILLSLPLFCIQNPVRYTRRPTHFFLSAIKFCGKCTIYRPIMCIARSKVQGRALVA